jgi:uncharacterized protein (TIGR02271 family)
LTDTNQQQLTAWIGQPLHGRDGDKIGTISDIYMDEDTGQPEWLAVTTGMFGTRVSFVPLREASTSGDELRVPYDKSTVKDAPNAEADGRLSQEEEGRLYQHYGLPYSEERSDSGLPDGGRRDVARDVDARGGDVQVDADRGTVGHDTSGPTTDDAMTRSEEELRVGTTSREAGRVRLRKWIETEQVTTTVPVSRERVSIEREPITDANVDRATSGPELSTEEHEVVLHEEQVVVDKQVVPKERIRLGKEAVQDEQQVGAEVQKERIEVEGDVDPDAERRARG